MRNAPMLGAWTADFRPRLCSVLSRGLHVDAATTAGPRYGASAKDSRTRAQ